jgi:hypothetical protein
MHINYRFYPSQARAVAEKVISEELKDAVYDEDDAKDWSVLISDKVRDAVVGKIDPYIPIPNCKVICTLNILS